MDEEPNSIAQFQLYQNYPNPFNPTTTIHYTLTPPLSQWEKVTLKVYDMLGREVAALVNEVKAPGTYATSWNASDVASGVYFYRLQAGVFNAMKKCVVLK